MSRKPALGAALLVGVVSVGVWVGARPGDAGSEELRRTAFAVAATAQEPALKDIGLMFGVYTSDKATAMYRKFTPVLEVLQEKMEASTGVEVDIELRIFKRYKTAIEALAKGDVDFVRFGPASYIISKQRNPKIQLLAMERQSGGKRFNGMIVVRADSNIRFVQDLADRRFAFGDENSTIGRFLSQDLLQQSGIHRHDLAAADYLGRHDKVFRAVEIGDYDAGAVKESTFQKLNTKGQLRPLEKFKNVTKPWIARADLDSRLVREIRRALLATDDPDALKRLKVTGFLKTSDAEYDFVREGMEGAVRFAQPHTKPPK